MAGEYILVVDDEPTIREVVELYLTREGYSVATATNGAEALVAVARRRPDLVVLDLMLPEIGGLDVCRQLRASHDSPAIIMLTARGEETDRVVGLELGADDYLAKPFSTRELVARVKAVRRSQRVATAPDTAWLVAGELRINVAARAVELAGEPVTLTVREFDLLLFLVQHPGQVFKREQLLDAVWGYTFASDASTVTVHIRRLREKIERDPAAPRYLHTVWGVGYKFEVPR
jgi:two-component system, OmpR family, response regulator ResD